ncbi:MAG: polysaccharide biosynthesis protein [Lachnospiraceae bacterium]|nr:polysaccharide biosynthesis protein [Lachnospiraceae bacterium]
MSNRSLRSNFLVQGSILALAGILVRVIGMLYRIPVVNIIGSDGNGIYSAAYNVYNIVLVLSSYGLPMAVSKLISARLAEGEYRNSAQIFRSALILSVITGGCACALLYFGAGWIERTLYPGLPGMAIPLRVLAPTVLIVAVLGVFRGFYQGHGQMEPTAVSQLIEQIVNAVVSVAAGYLLMRAYTGQEYQAAHGAAGSTLGTCLGALSALIFFLGLTLVKRSVFREKVESDENGTTIETGYTLKLILVTVIPIILGQTFTNINSVLDDILFNSTAVQTMSATQVATELGTYSTCFILLLSIPQGIASSMSASMLPSVVQSYTAHSKKGVRQKLSQTIRITMIIAMPCFIGMVVLGEPLIRILFARYDSQMGEHMLWIGAISVIFTTLQTITTSALQGIDRLMKPVIHSFISMLIHIVLVLILLLGFHMGIYSLVVGYVQFPLVVFLLNMKSLRGLIHYRLHISRLFLRPLLSSLIMGVACRLVYAGLYHATDSVIISFLPAFLVAVVVYFGAYIFLKEHRI